MYTVILYMVKDIVIFFVYTLIHIQCYVYGILFYSGIVYGILFYNDIVYTLIHILYTILIMMMGLAGGHNFFTVIM